ncbi:hypothetical protein ENH_00011040, partial [Eimeria necatrix]
GAKSAAEAGLKPGEGESAANAAEGADAKSVPGVDAFGLDNAAASAQDPDAS